MAFNLLITETTDEHIKIAGVLADKLTTSLMGRNKEEVPPLEIQFDKVAEHLESAVACATMGGALEGNRIMFKHPVTIKAAAQEKPEVVLDDFGLSEAIKQASAGMLTKSATNAFCDELVEAIDNAKIDAQGVMEMSMPLKLEFRDEATKAAFMSLGRKRKLKKAAAVIYQLGRDQQIYELMKKFAVCSVTHKKNKRSKSRIKYAHQLLTLLKRAAEGDEAATPKPKPKPKPKPDSSDENVIARLPAASGVDVTPVQEAKYRQRAGDIARRARTFKAPTKPRYTPGSELKPEESKLQANAGMQRRLRDLVNLVSQDSSSTFTFNRPPAFRDIPEYIGFPETGAIESAKPVGPKPIPKRISPAEFEAARRLISM